MEQDLATYLDTELKKLYPVYQWKVIKNSQNRTVEVYVSFHMEVDDSLQVQDMVGKTNNPGSIQFEDVLCFYDPAYAHVKPQNYLEAISVNSHTGIEKGMVDACLKQLNIVVEEGMVELEKFANDDTLGEFNLKWDEHTFEGTVQTLKSVDRYDTERIQMVLDNDESFIDRIKKDEENDGVERV